MKIIRPQAYDFFVMTKDQVVDGEFNLLDLDILCEKY